MTTYYTLELPIPEFPNYPYNTKLDGTDYYFNFKFGVRSPQGWYLTISDVDKNLLVSNIRIVPWIDLLTPYTREVLPKGNIILIPKSTQYPKSKDITLDNLNTEFDLVYISN